MKLKDLSLAELELMSYTDLTYELLKENKKSMNTPTIFRTICDLLEYSDSEYASKIGDYYTSLTLDKRFVLLENNEWDLRDHHSIEILVDDEETEETDDVEEEIEPEEEIEEDYEDDDADIIDTEDEYLDDLAIVEEDELEE